MGGISDVGRFLVTAGTVVIVIGLVLLLADKIPLGRLPGDFHVGGKRFGFYVPIVTCILVSVVLTVLVNLFGRR